MKLNVILLLILVLAAALPAQERSIDIERSTITIHVGKTGLFSAAAHEHWVNAPISSGVIDDSSALRVEFTVRTAGMKLKPDPKVDAKTQAQIQKDMEEMTLEIGKYPEIVFRSSRIEGTGEGQWRVDGTLSLHGAAKPVTVTVRREGDAYTAHTTIKQTDFGIKPISVAGGTVKVKNEVDLDFQIFSKPQ